MRFLIAALVLLVIPEVRADIPWPEVVQRLAYENQMLAHRPQGHAGEYLIVCTLYYTPMESGFTSARGFDATPVTKRGLRGRTFPRDFLRSVMKEGVGRMSRPVNGLRYLRYLRGVYSFGSEPSGGGGPLVARFSAAARLSGDLRQRMTVETFSPEVRQVFGSARWKIIDTGGGLRRWQMDCYWGEDEPMGPGKLMARPRGTTFEYAYSRARLSR